MRLPIAAVFVLAAGALAADDGLLRECLECHRPGQDRGEVPLLEGQPADYLRTQLARFRDDHRQGFPMTALAAGFDDAAVDRLATALAARPWRSAPARSIDAAAAARGSARVEQLACASCHGDGYLGSGEIPRLAGQQPGYLRRQLAAFGDGDRHHPPSGVGSRLYALSVAEVADIAAFLHALDAAPTQ